MSEALIDRNIGIIDATNVFRRYEVIAHKLDEQLAPVAISSI
jgi:hypothetical protein